jgi:hypothetical protein
LSRPWLVVEALDLGLGQVSQVWYSEFLPRHGVLTVGILLVDATSLSCGALYSGRDRGGMADQGDPLAVTPGLNPQDAEAVLGVLVGDALD